MNIGDKAKEYIFTVMGECVGCIEIDIAQNLKGELIKVVTDSHGGVGFLSNGATAPLNGQEHQKLACDLPCDKKRGDHICNRCWFKAEADDNG